MAKELRPQHEDISCDICGRTILKGERIEPYLAPGGQRHVVCELCTDRAYNEGWIREAAHDEMPATTRRPDQRRGLFGRLRRRRDTAAVPEVGAEAEPPVFPGGGVCGAAGRAVRKGGGADVRGAGLRGAGLRGAAPAARAGA